MQTTEFAAVAAAHSVDADRWQAEFSAVLDRIAPRFRRYEPLRHAGALMLGMVAGLDRKNCWTIAEDRGDATPDGLQHLLARASTAAVDRGLSGSGVSALVEAVAAALFGVCEDSRIGCGRRGS